MANKHQATENELFTARITEQIERADRGDCSVGDFLTPREIYLATSVLNRAGYRGRFAFYGGYPSAERARLVCLPEYALYGIDENDPEVLWNVAKEYADESTSVLLVSGSGFKSLSHRDFMGSILALGIKRSCLGDILVKDDSAYVFCDVKMAEYIKDTLTRVGRDAVKVRITTLPEEFTAEKRTESVTDTVASMRADSIISALINCSREKAKEYVSAGLCELNYSELTKPDAILSEGDVLSVRGKGKFLIKGTDGVTKRGRLRLWAEKYI